MEKHGWESIHWIIHKDFTILYSGGYSKMVGGELRIWEKHSEELRISNIINPKPNTLVASLQNNIVFRQT